MEGRELDIVIFKKMFECALDSIDVENDYLYKKGYEKGIELAQQELIEESKQQQQLIEENKQQLIEENKQQLIEENKQQLIEESKQQLREKIEKNEKKYIIGFFKVGNDIKTIAKALNITQKKVRKIIEEWKKQ